MTLRLLVIGDTLLDRDVAGRVERVCPDAPVPVVDVADVRERPGGAGLAALLAESPRASRSRWRPASPATAWATGYASCCATPWSSTTCDRARRPCARRGCARRGSRCCGWTTPARCSAATRPRCGASRRSTSTCCDGCSAGATPCWSATTADRSPGTLRCARRWPRSSPRSPWSGTRTRAAVTPSPERPCARRTGPRPGTSSLPPGRRGRTYGCDLPEQAAALQRHWRARAVCVTDGERGAVTALDDGELAISRAMPCPDGVDTCGAGDRFSAAVAVALGRGASPFSAVLEAHADVGRWLTDGGVGGIVRDRRRRSTAGHRPSRTPASVPTSVVERVRARGGTVVATGGCFDVLHAGHLALLEQARALGDCLVVLLNSDASVRRLKGAARPVALRGRPGRLLEGLACVDAVVVFEDDDPTATLARLRPDVWVKGGDYRDQDLPEARTVRALGGRIALVPYLDGHSTTRILQRLEVAGHRSAPAAPSRPPRPKENADDATRTDRTDAAGTRSLGHRHRHRGVQRAGGGGGRPGARAAVAGRSCSTGRARPTPQAWSGSRSTWPTPTPPTRPPGRRPRRRTT